MKKVFVLFISLLFSMLMTAQVKVGDILCAQDNDTLIVHPDDYTSGAIGVVFYVDETGEHGWVLHPQIQLTQTYWSYEYSLPWGLTGWQSIREAIYDFDGYDNTGFIRAESQYDHNAYPGAWAVDYEHGWYWPALGQLNILYGNALKVNESLQLIGGMVMRGCWWYWSSSVYGFDNDCALYCSYTGGMGAVVKTRETMSGGGQTYPMSVRSVRNF